MPTTPRHAPSAWIAVFCLFAAGCGDMPEIVEDRRAGPPEILLGPYLVTDEAGTLTLRFETDRRCVAGLRWAGGGVPRVERYASFGTHHVLPVRTLAKAGNGEATLLLDNYGARTLRLVELPAIGRPVTLAFLGGLAQPERLAAAADRLKSHGPDALVLLEPPVPEEGADREAWAERFFRPLAKATVSMPIFLPPGARPNTPAKFFPAAGRAEDVWARDLGCVHLIGLNPDALRDRKRRAAVLRWLEADYARRLDGTAWTVLLLPEPLFGPENANARLLEALEGWIEERDVDLVVSGGGPYYHRTHPLGREGGDGVRYIVTGAYAPRRAPGEGRDYTAAYTQGPHVCVLAADQGSLTWTMIPLAGGTPPDRLVLNAGPGEASEPVLAATPFVNEAMGVLALRQEVLAVARQAARAVADPQKSQTLSFLVTNPSPRPFEGMLDWTVPPGSPYAVTPPRIPFRLQPGEAIRARVKVSPTGQAGPAPELRVHAEGIGHTSQPLVLTREKRATLVYTAAPCAVDGFFNEDFWKEATELKAFRILGAGGTPTRTLRARAAYGPEGIRIAVRCGAGKNIARRKPRLRDHDDKVYREESVEVFLDPRREGRDYLQFAVNLLNVTLDRSSRGGLSWNPEWKSAVQHGRTDPDRFGKVKHYYDVELLLPWSALGAASIPAPGTAWGLNVTRNDYQGTRDKTPELEVVQWAQTLGSNGRSGCYGAIVFGPRK